MHYSCNALTFFCHDGLYVSVCDYELNTPCILEVVRLLLPALADDYLTCEYLCDQLPT